MAGFGNKVKLTVLKGMEAVGQSASSLASNAQQKLQELNLETQRREILSAFPLKAYDLWQKGEALPEPLDKMLRELSDLDERLGVLRAQRYAKVEGAQTDDQPDKAPQDNQSETANSETDQAAEPQPAEAPDPSAQDKAERAAQKAAEATAAPTGIPNPNTATANAVINPANADLGASSPAASNPNNAMIGNAASTVDPKGEPSGS